ncbi:hypothetical protein E1A91_D05G421900v1 [Gossypium mustelinum]|uniref:AAA+ ATPase domain-containing protein n=1 Tax=Gossypium mustelinum TaxID=34275 RepID=A0A5D2V7P6_GOSMU|nr:hypothetical protein E1A91_D05G421900v1 [Gossypium mustelinum]
MAEYVAPAVVKIVADQAKEYASPYFGYFFSYGKIVEDFTNQREALKSRKQRVDTQVDEAKRQTEIIYDDVDNWLTSAEEELKETQNLKDEIDRVKCFKWCPKWGWRYSLSKKLAEKIPIISKLLETSNFAQVGYRRPLQGIEFITSTGFMDSESSKSTFNQIMEAINAKGVNMIGLHGMPGVGKTTLAKEVGKHAREQKFFDKVVMFTMSQNPDINKIQEGKAEELFRSMQRVNKILVIVDDLWEEFKMESIGIPFGDEHEGCKILLITRRQQVCTKMNCKEIQLGILSEDEAWVLFRDKARLEDDCSTLNDVAKEVAAQCKGLPLAIVVVANALKGESLKGWRDANQRFKDSTHLYDEEVLGGVLEPLKLSYDYLKKGINQMTGNHIQMCFLLCSLFPEDEEILIEILIMCGIGVGLFPNFSSIEDKRKKIVEALKKLQKSGLLLETDGADTIRIHDVIRDFAHWLTSTGENRFMVKDTLEKWPHMEESYTAIALWNCSSIIKKFPDKVEFSKLKTLFLEGGRKRNRDFLVVFGTFFEEMKALQVLLLQCVSFPLKGFPSLPNLKTLWCHNCMLKNFSSSLTNMKSLEILALIDTEIDEISEELVKLSALQYIRLNLLRRIPKYFNYSPTHDEGIFNYSPTHNEGIISPPSLDLGLSGVEFEEEMNIPPNLVSRLTSLQELHVITKNNLNLLELKSLSRLTALSLRLSTNQIPLEDFVLPKLQRYAIVVGENYGINREAFIRTLDIQDFSSSLSAFNNLFCNVEELNLRNVGGQKNIVPSIDEMGLNELTSLQLKSCNDMEFLIDTKNDQGSTVAFSNLVELNIESMASLKGLCYGLSPTRFLQNLREVIINGCEELQVIFQIDKPLMLSNLTELSLHSLPKLKRIWEVKPSHRAIASLQSLKVVRIEYCDNLKTIFSPCLALSMLHLQELDIRYCDRLEQVIGFGEEDEIIENHFWTKLKTLRIVDCQLLKYVFATLSQGFPLLESLCLKNCPQLLQVFSSTEERDVIGDHILLNVPFLKNLKVSNCPQISCFIVQAQLIEKLVLRNVGNSHQLCNTGVPILNEGCIVVGNHEEVFQVQGRYSFSSIEKLELMNLLEVRVIWNDFAQVVTLENLTTLTLRDCKKLGYIFSPMMARSLSHLGNLFILGCEEIKRLILAKDQVSSSSSNGDTSLQPMSFPNLTQIVVTDCKNLSSLFPFGFVPVLPKLERLIVERNSKLEQVFELEEKVEVVAEEEMKFDKLKRLSLEELPGLIHFCPKGYHSVFPAMIDLKVRDCPKLTTGFFIDSQEFVHCKTKVPQLVEQDAVEESTTVRNAIFNENIDWSQGGGESQLPHIT